MLSQPGLPAGRRYHYVAGDHRDVAQPGSAPEWGSGGRGFKSRRPDSVKADGAMT